MKATERRPLRILLADPPVKEEYYAYYHPTMGILYLLGSLRENFTQHEVSTKYLQGFSTLQEHLKTIENYRPDIYGISFKTQMARNAFNTIRAIKKRFPELTVIAGGAHPSIMPEEVMRMTPVDACLLGECEDTIVRAVEAFQDGHIHFDRVPGSVFRIENKIHSTPLLPFKMNLDTFPFPDWDKVDFRRFPGMPYKQRHPYAGITVSRGCPFRCTFCSEPIWKIHGRPSYRARSPRGVIEEIDCLYKRGVKEIRLWCEELNADPDWAKELLHEIASMGKQDLCLSANIRGDKITTKLADAMKAANLWLVNIGIESASNRTLAGVRKQVTKEKIEESCRILSGRSIKIMGYFQFFLAWEENGGLCWETEKEAQETIRWALELNKKGHLHYIGTTVSTPRPGTPLWSTACKHKLLKTPINQPYPYLTEGMNLPGVSNWQVKRTMLRAQMAKIKVGFSSGNINFSIVPQYTQSVLRRLFKL